MKHGENVIGRGAGLKLGGEGMGGDILLRLPFVLLESSRKDGVKIWGRHGPRRSLGHSVGDEVKVDGQYDKGRNEGKGHMALTRQLLESSCLTDKPGPISRIDHARDNLQPEERSYT